MTTFFILIALIVIGRYLTSKLGYKSLELAALILVPYLIIHSIVWGLVSYEYGLFVEKRNSFEQTLKFARANGNKYESAAIVKEVAQWNIELAKYKYNNKTLFLDQYIDDRMESLEPIK